MNPVPLPWQMASRARVILDEDATLSVTGFVRSTQQADGGFAGRDGTSDIYYTGFALDALRALDCDPGAGDVAAYLRRTERTADHDLAHRVSWLRSAVRVEGPDAIRRRLRDGVLTDIEEFRSSDGGYALAKGRDRGSVYGCFLAAGAYAEVTTEPPGWERALAMVTQRRTTDGAYANEPGVEVGSSLATAAAVSMIAAAARPPDERVRTWLNERRTPEGGFEAVPGLGRADLLSTACVAYALAVSGAPAVDAASLAAYCESLWHDNGGFGGHAMDGGDDCEYTFYALLTLGAIQTSVVS